MIEPTKHEQLKQNLLVIGSEIINVVRNSPANIEDIYQKFKINSSESPLEKLYDALTFLWLLDFITIENGLVSLNIKKDVSEKTLF